MGFGSALCCQALGLQECMSAEREGEQGGPGVGVVMQLGDVPEGSLEVSKVQVVLGLEKAGHPLFPESRVELCLISHTRDWTGTPSQPSFSFLF